MSRYPLTPDDAALVRAAARPRRAGRLAGASWWLGLLLLAAWPHRKDRR